MEPTVTKSNGVVATFSDGTTAHRDRLSEYGYSLALQSSAFANIFKVGRTKKKIRGDLRDPNAVATAAEADGVPIGSNLPTRKITVTDKTFHDAATKARRKGHGQ